MNISTSNPEFKKVVCQIAFKMCAAALLGGAATFEVVKQFGVSKGLASLAGVAGVAAAARAYKLYGFSRMKNPSSWWGQQVTRFRNQSGPTG
jgi:hypothetical protein